ncbi:MAG TPA: DEAD/DEAH box helicase, partial [Gemmatimonadaceae bacterium]|nr:DEAD/DEAH box helicase [Gemmatimonadaceae bacterium]
MERDRMEQEQRTLSGVARSQNSVYVVPNDAASIGQFLDPALERVSGGADGTQLVVVTDDADTALAVARTADARIPSSPRVLPITSPRRAAHLLRQRSAPAIAGTPTALLDLVRSATLKLGAVRVVVIAWADTLLESGQERALESLLAEVPKEAARVLVTSRTTPEVEQLIERYARRARRVGDAAPGDPLSAPVQYVATSAGARAAMLRRVLDEVDADSVAIYARSERSRDEAAQLLRTLGYDGPESAVKLTTGDPIADAGVLILYDLPASRAELRAMLGDPPPAVIALVAPRQLTSLRALASGSGTSPWPLGGAVARARSAEESVRQELRAVLETGSTSRELLALEPLLDEYDGVEVAAAALRLLDQARERARRTETVPAPAAPTAAAVTTRIFINAGTRDNVGPGDLVGAISGEAGIPGSRIGRIELRENHSIVEVRSEDAEKIVQAI